VSDVLVLDGLGKDFGTNIALESLTCTIARGEIVGLLGPNGAGKTTTMKLVLGMLRPTRGSARFLGLDCTRDATEVKRRLGYSPDEPSFYDFLSGKETIDFVLNVRGVPLEPAWAALGPVVERLDFGEALEIAAGGYSHGTKKKLALLLALAHDPSLLLLDEPTNGLDPPTAARVRALLQERAEAGAAIVVSTHLLDMADLLCDRVLVVDHGRLIAEGTPAAVRVLAGVAPEATLEDAFLALVRPRAR
jgi:ABC-2 type transport system ATP-binding protein